MKGAVIVGDGLGVLLESRVSVASPVVGIGILRAESDGAVKVGDGLGVLLEVIVSAASVVVGIGILRVESDGAVKVGEGRSRMETWSCNWSSFSSLLNFCWLDMH